MVLPDGLRLVSEEIHAMLLHLSRLGLTDGTSKDVLVLLLGEVDIIVSVGVGELSWDISVILVKRVRSESCSVIPSLELEVRDGSTTVEIGNLHGSSVGLVVDNFSSGVPLLLLGEAFEDVVGADLHDAELLILASSGALASISSTGLESADLTKTSLRDHVVLKSHILGVLHHGVAVTTLSGTKSLGLSIGDPVIMSLVVLVVLLEGVIEGTVQPVELRDATKVERHLGVIIGFVVVTGTDGVEHLVGVRVDYIVTPVVVSLLPIILWLDGGVEVDSRHYGFLKY